ncbi:MAG: sel1 repeat family protein [Bacteroidetes bacterium]|nr:sel1 repeat family protein [Bacteroidota bacterium]
MKKKIICIVCFILLIMQFGYSQIDNYAKHYYDKAMAAKKQYDTIAFELNLIRLEKVILSNNPKEMDDSSLWYYSTCLYYARNILKIDEAFDKNALPYIEECASRGNYDCNFNLGYYYDNGLGGLSQNTEKAIKYYTIAKEGGDKKSMALNNLGWCYKRLNNYDLAIQYYKLSYELKEGLAASNLGWLYYEGTGVSKDYAKAFQYFKKGEEYEDMNKRYTLGLGHCYSFGYGVEIDYTKAMHYYRLSCTKKIARAYGRIGYLFKNGQGVPKNLDSAILYYRQGALLNDGWSANSLAVIYGNNKETYGGVDFYRDVDSIIKYGKIAIENGEEQGYLTLSKIYNKFTCPISEKLDVIDRGLKLTSSNILHELVIEYARLVFNNKISERYNDVITLLQKQSNQPSDKGVCLNFLGMFYWFGYPSKDKSKAAEYFQQAIDMGCEQAINNLKILKNGLR